MNRMIEKTQDELCDNAVNTVDRIMGRYGAGLEEACSIAGITVIDYMDWKEVMENRPREDAAEKSRDSRLMQEVVDKINQLLEIGITLENACEFARISVEEYEEYKKSEMEK